MNELERIWKEEVLSKSQNLPGRTEGHIRIPDVPIEIRNKHFTNTSRPVRWSLFTLNTGLTNNLTVKSETLTRF
jgi:hypothetical protein